ncbi:putative glycerol kinase [Podosphaera aphanis]|nr:putative glycerol kinase [Podosphaera aphanis]
MIHLDGLSGGDEQKNNRYIGSIDCGTTSTRFFIFDKHEKPIVQHQIQLKNYHPEPGWHEHDPLELVSSVESCIEKAVALFLGRGHSVTQIQAIGITNQRETTICWDTRTGEPLYNAIVWSDTRTGPMARELARQKNSDEIQNLCGLPISTYPSSLKLLWLMQNVKKIGEAYAAGTLSFGTVDSWLIYKLNGGKEAQVHVTDTTNASRTMFMNIHTRKYDDKLFQFFGIDREKVSFPRIFPSSDSEAFGRLRSGALQGIRITGCLGDQSAALVGQHIFSPGQAKNTYGTGCFLLYNIGEEPIISKSGLLTTVAYDFGSRYKPIYALEGSIAVSGSGIKFLIDNLGFLSHPSKITELAETVKDNGGVVFVTAFSGLFAPYWIGDARGTMFGITAHTQRGHIARAVLEATCFHTKAILEAMENDSGHKFTSLAVDGGMSGIDLCMQIQADICRISIRRPTMREKTALGVAIAAGLAVDAWQDLHQVEAAGNEEYIVFQPQSDEKVSRQMYRKWNQAVEMSRGWENGDEVDN